MGFIPKEAEWFLAEIVQLIEVEATQSSELNICLTLIKANGAEEAFEKSIRRGREQEMTYTNTDQDTVVVKFLGLHDLNVIHDPLEDGAELIFQVIENPAPSDIRKSVTAKEDLGVFAPIRSPTKRIRS